MIIITYSMYFNNIPKFIVIVKLSNLLKLFEVKELNELAAKVLDAIL